ncbi:MAG: hypothetical protein AAF806_31070 [Bacteroidota bacterium]
MTSLKTLCTPNQQQTRVTDAKHPNYILQIAVIDYIYFIRLRSRQFRGAYFVSERRSPQPDSLSYQGEEVTVVVLAEKIKYLFNEENR